MTQAYWFWLLPFEPRDYSQDGVIFSYVFLGKDVTGGGTREQTLYDAV